MNKDDGGPAFPSPEQIESCTRTQTGVFHRPYVPAQSGMALRDYLAAAALQGMLANTDQQDANLHRHGELSRLLAINCYEFADAMIAERNK